MGELTVEELAEWRRSAGYGTIPTAGAAGQWQDRALRVGAALIAAEAALAQRDRELALADELTEEPPAPTYAWVTGLDSEVVVEHRPLYASEAWVGDGGGVGVPMCRISNEKVRRANLARPPQRCERCWPDENKETA